MPHISQINTFLDENPSEFVIIQIQRERKIDEEHQNTFMNAVIDLFKHKLVTKKDTDSWFDPAVLTLEEVSKSKKKVWILCDEPFLENHFSPSDKSI